VLLQSTVAPARIFSNLLQEFPLTGKRRPIPKALSIPSPAIVRSRRVARNSWGRARSLSVYRFWRDLGYAIGALLSGVVADFVGLAAAIHLVAALTLVSGLVVVGAMRRPSQAPVAVRA
jgi:predicted MFS family arabinose efflux permease